MNEREYAQKVAELVGGTVVLCQDLVQNKMRSSAG